MSHRVLSAGQESRPQPKSKRRVSGYPTQEKTIQKEENKKKINIKNPKITKNNKKTKIPLIATLCSRDPGEKGQYEVFT